MHAPKTTPDIPSLRKLGVYGFDHIEPIIWAALVSGDPMLLIGNSGTGKTFLLNSLSETLNLEHRHYNASLISFDDLVGFPHPSKDFSTIHYLPTPATIWDAESVLIDEINRCKPEHQNRLFSLVHERRVQGIALNKLQYRWAALNPPANIEDPNAEIYDGVEPLDRALADRFSFIIEVPDWDELSTQDKWLIADPSGIGAVSNDDGLLQDKVIHWKKILQSLSDNIPEMVIDYACCVADQLKIADIRLSPRRVRQLTHNLLAIMAVTTKKPLKKNFLMCLKSSLPHMACGDIIPQKIIHAAHNTAWQLVTMKDEERWLADFSAQNKIQEKVKRLCKEIPDPDTGSLAIAQAMATLTEDEKTAFAVVVYPAAAKNLLNIGTEGILALAELAANVVDAEGTIKWTSHYSNKKQSDFTQHINHLKKKITGRRLIRARLLFGYLAINKIKTSTPVQLESDFNDAIELIAQHTGIEQ